VVFVLLALCFYVGQFADPVCDFVGRTWRKGTSRISRWTWPSGWHFISHFINRFGLRFFVYAFCGKLFFYASCNNISKY